MIRAGLLDKDGKLIPFSDWPGSKDDTMWGAGMLSKMYPFLK